MTRSEPCAARTPHPLIYLILILPFGIASGYVTVTLGYKLAHEGLNAAQVATVIAADLFPQTWKFVWAPLTDTTLTRKRWYVIGAALTAAGILACGLAPVSAGVLVLSTFVMLMSLATTLVAMATEALIAHHTPDGVKGRASGWFQAGNLGGNGLGGGAGLWLAQHVAAGWVSPMTLATACALSGLALLWIPDVACGRLAEAAGRWTTAGRRAAVERAWAQLKTLLRDLWLMARSRRGFLALLVVFLPMGTGAASNLWAAVAGGWGASADTVALINGTLGGFASMLGCLIGGHVCDRIDRKVAYVLYGVAQAACGVAMALSPHTEAMFRAFTLLYALLNGMAYAGFSAVALETIGLSAAATQYNVFASLSNMPILYMGLAEGWAYAGYGASAMLYTEAGLAAAAILVFSMAAAAASRRTPALAS